MQKSLLFITVLVVVNIFVFGQKKPANGRTNETYAWLFHTNGKLERLFPLLKPAFENKNNSINVSVTDANGNMLQVNGLRSLWLKDTIIKNAPVRVVLIRETGTWASSPTYSKTALQIYSKKNVVGNPVYIKVITTLYCKNKKKIKVETGLYGNIPEIEMLSTH